MPSDYTKLIISDLALDMFIGVYEHEKQNKQAVIINLEAEIDVQINSDDINETVSYEDIVNDITAIARSGHTELAETLAEEIASCCLKDKRVKSVKINIAKPDILPNTKSVGVEILRQQS